MQNTALSRAEYWLAQPEQCIQVEISSQYTGFPQQPQPGGEAESSPLPVGEGGGAGGDLFGHFASLFTSHHNPGHVYMGLS